MRKLKPELLASLRENLGDSFEDYERSFDGPIPVSIRLNPSKAPNLTGEPVPWCSTGLYLKDRPSFTLDPHLHAGTYYVQEASSMLLEQCFRTAGLPTGPLVALDLCAAPGGKSTHLRSLLPTGSLLVCNDVDRRRASVLCENVWKWGAANTLICCDVPERFGTLGPTFDVVLVDAPCSGEGLMRKDGFAVEQWSERLVRECSVRQHGILDAVWPAVKPGGVLIYSTCTFEPSENEEQVQRVITSHGAQHIEVGLSTSWGMVRGRDGLGIRCIPPRVHGEGLYIAVLRKPGEHVARNIASSDMATPLEDRFAFMKRNTQVCITEREGIAYATDPAAHHTAQRIATSVRTIAPGTPVAERKGNDWAPHAALALCPSLLNEEMPRFDLSRDLALRYLGGETLSATSATGHALAAFDGSALGWLKGAGNRWNNRWPAPWRIRMR